MFRAVIVISLSAMAACHREAAELTPGRPVWGTIRAGQSQSLRINVPNGYLARVTLRQQEIDLSLSAAGVRVDSSEYGDEVIYLAGGGVQALRIVASDEHTRQGKFVVAVNWMRPLTRLNQLAMEAQRLHREIGRAHV